MTKRIAQPSSSNLVFLFSALLFLGAIFVPVFTHPSTLREDRELWYRIQINHTLRTELEKRAYDRLCEPYALHNFSQSYQQLSLDNKKALVFLSNTAMLDSLRFSADLPLDRWCSVHEAQ